MARVLTDFRPKDHIWHRAAWFSLKEIDDLNYWEENRDGVSAGRNKTIDGQDPDSSRLLGRHSFEAELPPAG